ncbi:MAG: L,D-transpeptidase family protein [Gammaproteobacteria bacterium]
MKRLINYCLIFTGILLLSACGGGRYATGNYSSSNLNATVKEYKPHVDGRLKPYFARAQVAYPPARMALLAFKEEKRMELWARNRGTRWTFIRSYPILAAAGSPGPKLHAGDDQVPEGIYHIAVLNPHSHYHLSLGLNYPNAFDLQEARHDRRSNLGGEIFIHGSDLSIGCLAMGNRTIEELFVLAYETGLSNTQVIISPNDLRHERPARNVERVAWLPQLYSQLRNALATFS